MASSGVHALSMSVARNCSGRSASAAARPVSALEAALIWCAMGRIQIVRCSTGVPVLLLLLLSELTDAGCACRKHSPRCWSPTSASSGSGHLGAAYRSQCSCRCSCSWTPHTLLLGEFSQPCRAIDLLLDSSYSPLKGARPASQSKCPAPGLLIQSLWGAQPALQSN